MITTFAEDGLGLGDAHDFSSPSHIFLSHSESTPSLSTRCAAQSPDLRFVVVVVVRSLNRLREIKKIGSR
jgi:hypothetical protein